MCTDTMEILECQPTIVRTMMIKDSSLRILMLPNSTGLQPLLFGKTLLATTVEISNRLSSPKLSPVTQLQLDSRQQLGLKLKREQYLHQPK